MEASEVLVLAVRVALATAFAVAAEGKLRHGARTRTTVAAFGVPSTVVPVVAVAVGIADLAVAVTLVLAPGPGAAGALGLLAAYTAATGVNLVRGRRPECHCFGDLSRGPIGARTIARNVVLAAGAVVVSVAGHDVATAPVLVVVAASATGGVLVGRRRARSGALAGTGPLDAPTLVVFVEPACIECRELAADLAAWRQAAGPVALLVVDDLALAASFGVRGTPGAVLLDRRGNVAAGPVAGAGEVRRLWSASGPITTSL